MKLKILPFEEMEYTDRQIGVDEAQITYIQKGDCTESEDSVQSITLSARNNGMARFVNIKTDGWSVDSSEELLALIRDFENRVMLKKDGKKS